MASYFIQVEELLTSYLKDVGITEEQFVMACEAGSSDQSKVADRVSKMRSGSVHWSVRNPAIKLVNKSASQSNTQLSASWSVYNHF